MTDKHFHAMKTISYHFSFFRLLGYVRAIW